MPMAGPVNPPSPLAPSASADWQATIGDLLPSEDPTGSAVLFAARATTARAFAGGQRRQPLDVGPGGAALAAAGQGSALEPGAEPDAGGGGAPGTAPLVWRRDLPLWTLPGGAAPPPWAVGREARSLGAMRGVLGQPVWLDVFDPLPQLRYRREAAADPFLVLAGCQTAGSPQAVVLGPGSVWLRAQLLAPDAPPAGWVGLRIKSGRIEAAAQLTGSPEVSIAPQVEVTLTLDLAPPAAAAGSGPGADARAADVQLPQSVTFVIATAQARVTALAPALLAAYGSSVTLHWQGGAPPTYRPELQSVLIPTAAGSATFAFAHALSQLVQPAGAGRLDELRE